MDKTLATLRRGGVAISDIYVFVVDAEKELYQTACPGYQIIVGRLGLVQQRAFIQNFFSENDTIVMMDDDITEIYRPIDSKTKEQILDLPGLFHLMKIRMISEHVTICGVYPCNNLKFALGSPEVSNNFRYLVGAFYIIKNTRDPELQPESSILEDRERTVLYYLKEKKCLRFNWIGIKTKYFGKGGLESDDRITKHNAEANALVNKFPKFFMLKKTKTRLIKKQILIDCKCRRVRE
jgi:hypothetical protein